MRDIEYKILNQNKWFSITIDMHFLIKTTTTCNACINVRLNHMRYCISCNIQVIYLIVIAIVLNLTNKYYQFHSEIWQLIWFLLLLLLWNSIERVQNFRQYKRQSISLLFFICQTIFYVEKRNHTCVCGITCVCMSNSLCYLYLSSSVTYSYLRKCSILCAS